MPEKILNGNNHLDAKALRFAVDAAGLAVFAMDLSTGEYLWNEHLRAMLGVPGDCALDYEGFLAMVHPEDRERVRAAGLAAIDPKGSGAYDCEMRMVRPDGETVWVRARGQTAFLRRDKGRRRPARIIGVARDETERVRSLAQKDLLIREMSHRVKNSLQTVATLLDIQTRMERDPFLRERLEEARGRVSSVAKVHQHLYGSRTLARVPLSLYLRDVVRDLAFHHEAERRGIDTVVEAEEVEVPSGQATDIGLIVNELVCNAFRHAFPDDRSGTIRVSVGIREGALDLRVEDDGIGTGCEPPEREGSLGMMVVRTLADQLGAGLELDCRRGCRVALRIPLVP
ncbi:MAG TPA: histidine kinase dimerization/phosphoacceptor domain -containing protein [Azospirillaceae bacterium]|nr:histidine kinase dimerization/phosphoacceptor domain -containing protein [Azospirillaceae bacterium]